MPDSPVELERARALVAAYAVPLAPVSVALEAALGRVLAEDLRAYADVPAFDNAAMDGYAVRAADSGPGARLRVVAEARAGAAAAVVVGAGEACEISTGAPMPAGADAVVRVEDTRQLDGEVELGVAVERRRDVRGAGEDVRAGDIVLPAGVRLAPADLGVAASIGRISVAVGRRPRVAVITTGDELTAPGAELPAGGVRNSGAFVIPALVAQAGGETASIAHAADDPAAIRRAIDAALAGADITVVTGGMSVGRHDHVRPSFRAAGVEPHFEGVAVRPGKPTCFGTRAGALAFGLPGNPVASLVTFVLLVRPAILALAGDRPERVRTVASLDREVRRVPGRERILRCRLRLEADGWHAHTLGPQRPHTLSAIVGADALALIPAGEGVVPAGERVTVELIR